MAVIPPDAGIRMRTQADPGQLQALAPVRGIPAGLPEFQPGQAFTARIQELLPDNTYKALVAGRQLTLQLPEGANPGDVLELTVVDRSAQTVIARRTESQANPVQVDARPYPYARISDAGRLIGGLLPAEGEVPPPAALNRGQPLLPQAPGAGAELAPVLQKAVSQSGLFYEAHQAQWVTGERSLASLRAEPQGQLPPPRPLPSASPAGVPEGNAATRQIAQQGGDVVRPETLAQTRSDAAGRPAEPSLARSDAQPQSASSTSNQQANAPVVPDSIRSIVQQQLDAVATQRLAWHGEVWPGQNVEWAIQRDAVEERDAGMVDAGDARRWSTSLRLTMPRLGTIDAVLQLTGNGLSIRLAAEAEAAGDLREQIAGLREALVGAGLDLQSVDIRHEA
jgi:hypothetical protein